MSASTPFNWLKGPRVQSVGPFLSTYTMDNQQARQTQVYQRGLDKGNKALR